MEGDGPTNVLYTNIDLKLRNKKHGPIHYKPGVTCVYNGHMLYTLVVITRPFNPPISQFGRPCNEFNGVSGQSSNLVIIYLELFRAI